MIAGAAQRRLLVVAAAGLLAGCAAAVRLEDGAYVVRAKGYRVTPPSGWERIASDADLALRHPSLGVGLMAHGTCEGRAPTRPLPLLVRHLRFGLTDVLSVEESPLTLAGWPALASRLQGRLDGVAVAVQAVTVEGPRCVYDLVVVSPPEALGAALPDFERFTQSFTRVSPP